MSGLPVIYGRNIDTTPNGQGIYVDGLLIQNGFTGPTGVKAGYIYNTPVSSTSPATGNLIMFNGTDYTPSSSLPQLTITNAPINATDVTNKSYVDALASGVNVHPACRVYADASSMVVTASTYTNGTADASGGLGIGATLTDSTTGTVLVVDTVTLSLNDRVLVNGFAGASQKYNGIYYVSQLGVASTTQWILTRATDSDNSVPGQVEPGDFTFIYDGSALYKGSSWVETNIGTGFPPQNAIKLGTDAVIFDLYASPGGGVTNFSGGTTGLTPSTPVNGPVTLGGILNQTNGGTGLDTTAATNGQLLIGNGSGLSLNTLTAGTAIGIANGSGTITINNNGVTSIGGGASGMSFSSSTGNVTISGGPLVTSFGGTGLSTIGNANQLLGVNITGTSLEYKDLVGGTDISVTPTAGVLTVSSTLVKPVLDSAAVPTYPTDLLKGVWYGINTKTNAFDSTCITIGQNAATGASNHIAIGTNANTGSGSNNISFGFGAGSSSSSNDCLAIGTNALNTNTGSSNIAIGTSTLSINTSGSNNTVVGHGSLSASTTTSNTVAIGYNAGVGCVGADSTIAIGTGTLANTNSTNGNVAIGVNALNKISTGNQNDNIAMGINAGSNLGSSMTQNTLNVFIGAQSGLSFESGDYNIMIGGDTYSISTTTLSGSNNICLGYTAGGYYPPNLHTSPYVLSGSDSDFMILGNDQITTTYVGGSSTTSLFVGPLAKIITAQTILGYSASADVSSTGTIVIGDLAKSGSGSANICIGESSGNLTNTGNQNVNVGALNFTSLTTGSANTSVGYQSMQFITSGSNNTAVGANVGSTANTGSGNVLIGNSADVDVAGRNNAVVLGNGITSTSGAGAHDGGFYVQHYAGTVTGNAAVFVGNELVEATSSRKFKHDIQTLEDNDDAFLELRPVSFVGNNDPLQRKQVGFIAEEVEKCLPEVVTYKISEKEEREVHGIDYPRLVAPLVNQVQKLMKKMKLLEEELARLKK